MHIHGYGVYKIYYGNAANSVVKLNGMNRGGWLTCSQVIVFGRDSFQGGGHDATGSCGYRPNRKMDSVQMRGWVADHQGNETGMVDHQGKSQGVLTTRENHRGWLTTRENHRGWLTTRGNGSGWPTAGGYGRLTSDG